MNRKVLAPYGAVSVGELSNTPHPHQVIPYVSAAAQELDMVFEFSMIRLGTGNILGPKYIYQPFPLSKLKALTSKWQTFVAGTDAWTTVFIENHDNARAVSRFGDTSTPELWKRSAKTIALWQITLTGTLFLYQGQEIGMTNMPESWGIEEYKDVESSGFYAEAVESGDAERVRKTLHGLGHLARDHSRIPFQWDDSVNAGFTSADAEPWMRVHDEYRSINVARQRDDPGSILSFYKEVLKLRKQHRELLVFGTFELLDPDNEAIFAYVKEDSKRPGKKAVVVLNMSKEQQMGPDVVNILDGETPQLLISTISEGSLKLSNGRSVLRAWEGRVYVNY
jgi:oligo-1,6-glucosidase